MGTGRALSSRRGPNMGCLASKLSGETEREEGVGWRPKAARSPRLLAPPGESCLGTLDAATTPGGRQLLRVKAKARACTHPLLHSLPLLGTGTKGEDPEKLSEHNHAFSFLCFRRLLLFSQRAAQAGSTHAISSTTPHAASTRGRS